MNGQKKPIAKDKGAMPLIAQAKKTVKADVPLPIAIMPVRYALGDNKSKTPPVSGHFKVDGPPAKGDTHYTLRRLRMGYLYVFNEKDKSWACCRVLHGGYFKPLPKVERPNYYGDYAKWDIVCNGRVMQVPEDKPFWLGFSDAVLTKEKLAKATNDIAFRKGFMRRFDPATVESPHSTSLKNIGQYLSECKERIDPAAFWYSNEPFYRIGSMKKDPLLPLCIDELEKKMVPLEGPIGRGALVAVDDPAAIVMDLGTLMEGRYQDWLKESDNSCPDGKNRKWALWAYGMIGDVRDCIENQAVQKAYKQERSNRYEDLMSRGGVVQNPEKWWSYWADEKIARRVESKVATLKKEAWDKYAGLYDEKGDPKKGKEGSYNETQRVKWKTNYDNLLEKYDNKNLLPLAELHVDWMKSKPFHVYFDSCFDDSDDKSGKAFTTTLTRCIEAVQDKLPCAKYITAQFKLEAKDNNLFVRAVFLNQKTMLQKINEIPGNSVSLSDKAWDGLISGWKEVAKAAGEEGEIVIGRFLASMGKPVADLFNGAVDGPLRHALLALGAVSGCRFTKVEIALEKKDAVSNFVKNLMKMSHGPVDPDQLQRAVTAKMAQLEIKQVDMKGQYLEKRIVMIDDELHQSMPKFTNSAAEAEWLANKLMTAEQAEGLGKARWRDALHRNMGGKGYPVVFGVVGGILQFTQLVKMAMGLDDSLSLKNWEPATKFSASMGTFAGNIGETIGDAMVSRAASNAAAEETAKKVRFAGKRLGLVAGLILAGVEFCHMYEDGSKGNYGVAGLYLLSGLTSAGGAIFLYASATWAGPVGWICVAVAIGASIAIDYYKDTEIEDWLQKGCWRNCDKKEVPFKNIDEDIKALGLAFKAGK